MSLRQCRTTRIDTARNYTGWPVEGREITGLDSLLSDRVLRCTVTHMKLNHAALRVIRERTGKSQSQVAELAGIDRSNYAHIEAGRRRGTEEQIKAFAEALQIPFDALLGPELDRDAAA